MAEAAMFSVAAKLLSTIASPAFEKAYKRACSIRSARSELSKLSRSIETVQAVLLDAESKQDSSVAVKIWIKRVRDVLYDAEDLFDEVATDDLLGKHKKGNKLLKKVRAFVSDDSIAKRVEGIRRILAEILEDMKHFQFVECRAEKTVYDLREGRYHHRRHGTTFVGLQNVVGRDQDTKVILEMLSHEPNDAEHGVHVIAIVGIGGMGKTTLAQLVYNHEDVRHFDKRWFTSISDTSDDGEVFGRILQSMCEEDCANFSVDDLQSKIKDSVKDRKFLLVLDDVWDHDRGRWIGRMSSLSGGAKGSKIVVTTRSLEVARAVGALETHTLDGLSEADSWDLFKRVVGFTPEQERDSRWTSLGEEIVKKCANVPLAIKSIASLLFERNTVQEWESFSKEELPKLGEGHKDGIMPVLRLSYEHLPSNLKHCFAYCALFPKNYNLRKDELVYLWIAQGYIKPSNEKQTVEDVGHSYFMDLFRRSFFQDLKLVGNGDAVCKMHDLIHDLAQHVAGDEIVMLTASSTKPESTLRHVGVWGLKKDGSVAMPISQPLHNANPLRTFIDDVNVIGTQAQNPESRFQLANLRLLRALSCSHWYAENVPSCIGELKHLRYLRLWLGRFKRLPDSITRLKNLCTLDIGGCFWLEALPDDFRKLISLRHLIIANCMNFKHMPPGFEELTSLQRLDEFKVGKVTTGNRKSRLDVLSSLELKEHLTIRFVDETDDWDGVECWQPPLTLQGLVIYGYKGVRIPRLRDDTCVIMPKLTRLDLYNFSGVKCLPPLRHVPKLNHLTLSWMKELQYIQEEDQDGEKQSPQVAAGSSALFLPDLKELELKDLPKLKGWWRKGEATMTHKDEHLATDSNNEQASSQSLSFPSLVSLTLERVNINMIQQLFSSFESTSPSSAAAATTTSSPSSLEFVRIKLCHELLSFPGESLTSLRHLRIWDCKRLKEVRIAPSQLNIIEELTLWECPQLELWGEKKRGVDWNSLPSLRKLIVKEIPSEEVGLPHCLRLLEELGQLKITSPSYNSTWIKRFHLI